MVVVEVEWWWRWGGGGGVVVVWWWWRCGGGGGVFVGKVKKGKIRFQVVYSSNNKIVFQNILHFESHDPATNHFRVFSF